MGTAMGASLRSSKRGVSLRRVHPECGGMTAIAWESSGRRAACSLRQITVKPLASSSHHLVSTSLTTLPKCGVTD